ncbi:MAG: CBS domain-containing protein [candidate division KSB1 bacterium]|nr:CBS domain-containing protein [candidate division KSB1 bacterium]
MFTETGATTIPVVDAEDRLAGVIGVEELRNLILKEQTWDWLVAEDVLVKPRATLHPGQSVKESLGTLDQLDISEVPVVDDDGQYLGNVHRSGMREMINNRLIRNQIKTT